MVGEGRSFFIRSGRLVRSHISTHKNLRRSHNTNRNSRSLRSNNPSQSHQRPAADVTANAARLGSTSNPFFLPFAAAAAFLGSLSLANSASSSSSKDPSRSTKGKTTKSSSSSSQPLPDWTSSVAQQAGSIEVLNKEILLQQDHPFLEDDHMFAAFVNNGIVNDMTGYYNTLNKKFTSIISLGRETAGFPRVVHGGLTAAIFDETFGGLLFSLKKDKALNFWGPAYTVHLEVQYKNRIRAGKTVLCTTELESFDGRKIWMKATMSDGPDGQVFATARALFVAPKPFKLVKDVGKYMWEKWWTGGR
jgi:acyl-coenzyme A thioesterase PaaI-like protein